MKRLSQIAMTGVAVLTFGILPYVLPTTSYAGRFWRGTGSSGGENYQSNKPIRPDSEWMKNSQRRVREDPTIVIKPLIKMGDPTGVTNKLIDVWKKGKYKGKMPPMLERKR